MTTQTNDARRTPNHIENVNSQTEKSQIVAYSHLMNFKHLNQLFNEPIILPTYNSHFLFVVVFGIFFFLYFKCYPTRIGIRHNLERFLKKRYWVPVSLMPSSLSAWWERCENQDVSALRSAALCWWLPLHELLKAIAIIL